MGYAAFFPLFASIAFHTEVTIDDVPHEGIDALDALDVGFADDLGYSVKLIGQARRVPAGVAVGVFFAAQVLIPAEACQPGLGSLWNLCHFWLEHIEEHVFRGAYFFAGAFLAFTAGLAWATK